MAVEVKKGTLVEYAGKAKHQHHPRWACRASPKHLKRRSQRLLSDKGLAASPDGNGGLGGRGSRGDDDDDDDDDDYDDDD